MTAPLQIDPVRCLELASWAREVAKVREQDVAAGADEFEAVARTRENMAAIADQLDAAASAAQPPVISHDFLPPLDTADLPPTTDRLRALQAPGIASQPRSIPNDGPAIVDLVIADLRERASHGEAKYGVRLQPNNGRVALVDLYQELLDATQYIRQEIEERRRSASWRAEPPTLAEVKAGAEWWWYRQRGEDGYTEPRAVQIGWDDDEGLFFVEPGCPPVTPEEYGDGVEWTPCPMPRSQ